MPNSHIIVFRDDVHEVGLSAPQPRMGKWVGKKAVDSCDAKSHMKGLSGFWDGSPARVPTLGVRGAHQIQNR